VEFAYLLLSGRGLRRATEPYVPSRPPLGEEIWSRVDRALVDAIAACEVRVIVVLGRRDAEELARSLYVWAEPGPNVVAIGHEDASVSWHMDFDICDANEAPLRALLEDAQRDLQRGELASALVAVAANLRLLRRPV
jgi:hypothetical protein